MNFICLSNQDVQFNLYDPSEMYPHLPIWHLFSIFVFPKKKSIIVLLFSLVIFLTFAIIIFTARKAWEENSWQAWAVLVVVAVQVS